MRAASVLAALARTVPCRRPAAGPSAWPPSLGRSASPSGAAAAPAGRPSRSSTAPAAADVPLAAERPAPARRWPWTAAAARHARQVPSTRARRRSRSARRARPRRSPAPPRPASSASAWSRWAAWPSRPAYPVDVVWRGRCWAAGRRSAEVSLPVGRQVLTLVAARRTSCASNVTVDVRAGRGGRGDARPRWARSTSAPSPTTARCSSTARSWTTRRSSTARSPRARTRVAFKWPDGARREEAVEVDARAPGLRDGPQGLMRRSGGRRPAPSSCCRSPRPSWAQSAPEEQARGLLEDGRAYRERAEGQAGPRQLQHHRHRLPGHRLGGRRAAGDRPLPPRRRAATPSKAREAFEQVAKRFPQSDGAPGAYYYLGRLTLDARRHRRRAGRRAGPVRARAAALSRAATGCRAPCTARRLAHRKAGRLPGGGGRRAARRARVPHQRGRARGAVRGRATCSRCWASRAQAMEEFQQIRNRFPASEWAPRALDRITALYRLYGGGAAGLRARPRVRAGGGRRAEGRARAPHDARAARSGSPPTRSKGVVPVRPRRQAGREPHRASTCAAWPARRGASCWWRPRLAVRIGPARHQDLRRSPATSRACRSRSSSIEAALVTAGRQRAGGGREAQARVPLRRQAPVPGPVPRRQGARGHRAWRSTARAAWCCWTADQKTVRVFDETGRVLRTIAARRRRLRAQEARGRGRRRLPATPTWPTRTRRGLRLRRRRAAPHHAGRRGAAQADGAHPRSRGRGARLRRQAEKVLRYR